jgi:hypothetical protein
MRTDKNRLGELVCAAALALLGVATAHGQAPSFNPGCTLPFAEIATTPDPFVSCGNCGVVPASATATEAAAKAAESKAKNNLCGDMTKKTVVDFGILTKMQALPINKNALGDRHTLKNIFPLGGQKIGEGSVVQLKAFVKEAHISDCNGGEEVNCKSTGPEVNDIHIPLVDPASDPRTEDECNSVTAEMIPHFRPAAWSQFDMKTPVNNPVRVTGQLFFDNSHDPCAKDASGKITTRNKPARISLWEIHPVYRMDVCTDKDPSKCDIANDAMWVAYDKWLGMPGSVTEASGQQIRTQCENLHGRPSPAPGPTRPGQCPAPGTASGSKPAKGPGKNKHQTPAPPSK